MITLKAIEKTYDLGQTKISAVSGIDLQINRGDFLAITGPSGSGKSTLLNILGILDNPTKGSYLLEDYDITMLSDKDQSRIRNKHFGFIFQSFNLFSELSALENVMLPMSYAKVPSKIRRERAAELLADVGLQQRMHHLPSMMSGGEQQRTAIARALANQPDLILADEPTGNLPTDKGEEVLRTLEMLNKRDVTIVMVTHNEEQARKAKRRIHIQDGHIVGERT
jgi:putative ABC transport system ATP-binding protein